MAPIGDTPATVQSAMWRYHGPINTNADRDNVVTLTQVTKVVRRVEVWEVVQDEPAVRDECG